MKALLLLVPAICLAGCTSPEQRRETAIMDAIERTIQLPPMAGALNQYARTYGLSSSDVVVGFYFRPASVRDQSFCEATKKYGPDNGQISLACPPPEGMRAGERRWFADQRKMPDSTDGGCSSFHIEFNLRSQTFVQPVRCSGVG